MIWIPTLVRAPRGRYHLPVLLVALSLAGVWRSFDPPPRIADVVVRASRTTAEVSWTTSEPTDAVLGFSGPGSAGCSTRRAQSGARIHTIEIHGLKPASTYAFFIDARDRGGQATRISSALRTRGGGR